MSIRSMAVRGSQSYSGGRARLRTKKRVHRIWKDAGLQLPRRRPKKRCRGPKGEVIHKAEHMNHVWTYDFMEYCTERGRKIGILIIVDEYSRECVAIPVVCRYRQ